MKIILAGILALFASYGVVINLQYQPVFAQSSLSCDGLSPDTAGGTCAPVASEPSAGGIVKTAVNLLSVIAGIISVAMLMIAGVKFVTSQGDSGKVSSARNTALYAIIGLIIVAIAQTIVYFVLGSVAPRPPEEANVNRPLYSIIDTRI